MKMHRSIQADAAGRINLGKACAGALFILSKENNRIVLEPAKIISENEFDQEQTKQGNLRLTEQEWEQFERIMESNEEPPKKLRKLLRNGK